MAQVIQSIYSLRFNLHGEQQSMRGVTVLHFVDLTSFVGHNDGEVDEESTPGRAARL